MEIRFFGIQCASMHKNYVYDMIYNAVVGEGGDGWTYICCEDPIIIAEDFCQYCNKKNKYSISILDKDEKSCNVKFGEKDQDCWFFTSIQPSEDDMKYYEYVVILYLDKE